MSIVLDIILAAVIIITVFNGWRRGFIKTVMGLATFLVAFFGGIYFTPALAEVYYERIFSGKIADGIANAIDSIIQNGSQMLDISGLFEQQAFIDIANRFNIDIAELESHYAANAADVAATDISRRIAEPAAQALSSICAFITLFVVIIVVLKLLTYIIDAVFKLPILKGLNRFFGFLIGCALSLLYAWLLSMLFVTAVPWLAAVFPEYIYPDAALSAPLTMFFYNNNLFAGLVP